MNGNVSGKGADVVQKKHTSGVTELHDTLKVEVEFLKKSSFCGFRVQKK